MSDIQKPVIGVMPLYDDDKSSLWMLPGYLEGITRAGGIPLIFPLDIRGEDADVLYNMCGGILLTGGHDVDPALYGEKKSALCSALCQSRDSLESRVFKKAYRDNKPLLGICRGIQLMNVLMGGTLYQDIEAQMQSDVTENHHMAPPYDREAHRVKIVRGTPLYTLLREKEIPVNSYHHQGIKKCGGGIIPMAFARDGLVEAISCKRKSFMWGIQWHPEFYSENDKVSAKIFEAFIKAAKQQKAECLGSQFVQTGSAKINPLFPNAAEQFPIK